MAAFRSLLAAVVLISAIAPAATAHHSFAMYDKNKEMTLEGVVKEVQWKNPHTFIQLVVGKGESAVEWSLEGGSPNLLERNGWTRQSVIAGDKVKILLYPLKSGQPGGSFLEVHKADGKVFYYHG